MNKESQFYQVLVKIENGIKRMSEQTAAVRWYLEADDLDTAYDKALGLEAVTEKTTLLTRVLPAYTGYRTAKEDVADIIAKEIPVEIGFTAEGWFCLGCQPCFRKSHPGLTIISELIYCRLWISSLTVVRGYDTATVFSLSDTSTI